MMDSTQDGRRLKLMPIVDEYTRECLAIEVERSITAEDVVATLARLFEERGEPSYIRSDNGPEFVAAAVKRWLEACGVETLYIEPGSPWENAYGESFNGRFGDELLKREEFTSPLEAKVLVEEYRQHYNNRRPHSALGYWTPSEFAVSCAPIAVSEGGHRRGTRGGARIDAHTLIGPGTENGVRTPVVCCPHAGNANTKRKVRAANIALKYGTSLSPLVHILIACLTLVHRRKLCND